MTVAAGGLGAVTSSPAQTKDLAAALAGLVAPGDLLVLTGELGAGKTAFVQGFATALDVGEPVTSPTFTIAQRYDGRLTVHHLDVYRLDRLGEVADLGLPELLDDDAVVLVEWGDAIAAVLPPDRLEVVLTFGAGDDERVVTVRPVGERWCTAWPRVVDALDRWIDADHDASADPPC